MAGRNALTDFFGDIVTDIRQKVVEQGWFGRETTQAELPTVPDCPPRFPPPVGGPMSDSPYGWAAWKEARAAQDKCAAQVEPSDGADRGNPADRGSGHDYDL